MAFLNLLGRENITVSRGRKDGIFVATVEGVEIGSISRILQIKRKLVAEKLEPILTPKPFPLEPSLKPGPRFRPKL